MYYILTDEEYEKLYNAAMRQHIKDDLSDKTGKLTEWESKENMLMVNYYAGCVDTLRKIQDFM